MQQPSPTRLPGTPHERIEGHRPPYSAQIGRILQYVEGPSKKSEEMLSPLTHRWKAEVWSTLGLSRHYDRPAGILRFRDRIDQAIECGHCELVEKP
jgi:hypothetical protein